MPAARRTVEIAAPPDTVMAVITDFAAYPSFLPEMQRVEVLHQAQDVWEVRFSVALVRPLTYTLRLVREGPLRLRWSLVEGAFQSNEGGWELVPLAGGAATQATYEIDVSVGMFVPGSLVRTLVEGSLPETLARFKQRAEARVIV